MTELQIFKNSEFGEVRTTIVSGKPYFYGSDVTEALGYSNPKEAVTGHCEEDEVTTCSLTDSLDRKQEAEFITGGDVHRLVVLASKQNRNKEVQIKAKRYASWIFDEMIPSVKANGCYAMPGIHVPDFKGIPLETLTSYQRIQRTVMKDSGKSPKEIATEFKKVSLQFGIKLSDNFDQLVFRQESLF